MDRHANTVRWTGPPPAGSPAGSLERFGTLSALSERYAHAKLNSRRLLQTITVFPNFKAGSEVTMEPQTHTAANVVIAFTRRKSTITDPPG